MVRGIMRNRTLREKLANKICKYLEINGHSQILKKLQNFVSTFNSRTNRFTNLAPNKITRKKVPRLVSLIAEQSLKLV